MGRSQHETKSVKTKTYTDLKLYKEHKTFSSKLCEREKRNHYEPLDMKNYLNSKEFWKTAIPFLSDKNTVFSEKQLQHESLKNGNYP